MCSRLAVVAASAIPTISAIVIVVSVISANCAIIAVEQLNSDY